MVHAQAHFHCGLSNGYPFPDAGQRYACPGRAERDQRNPGGLGVDRRLTSEVLGLLDGSVGGVSRPREDGRHQRHHDQLEEAHGGRSEAVKINRQTGRFFAKQRLLRAVHTGWSSPARAPLYSSGPDAASIIFQTRKIREL